MKNTGTENILNLIGKIYETSAKSQLDESIFEKNKKGLEKLAYYLNVTPTQALFYAVFFTLNSEKDNVGIKDLAEFFECKPLKILEYYNDIDELLKKKSLKRDQNTQKTITNFLNEHFIVENNLIKTIFISGRPLQLPKIKFKNSLELINYVDEFYYLRDNEEISVSNFKIHVENAIRQNKSLPIIKSLSKVGIEDASSVIILFYAISQNIIGEGNFCIKTLSKIISENKLEEQNIIQGFTSGNHILLRLDFLFLEDNYSNDEFDFKLTDKTYSIMYETEIIPKNFIQKFTSSIDFLEEIAKLFNQIEKSKRSVSILNHHLICLLMKNKNVQIVKEMSKFKIRYKDVFLLYYMIRESLYGKNRFDIHELVKKLYQKNNIQMEVYRQFIEETNGLQVHNLIEITEGGLFGETEATLTEKTNEIIKSCQLIQINRKKENYSIHPSDIIEKALFFNDEDKIQIKMLTELMEDEKFSSIQKRMKDLGMPYGVSALLYGAPGTGKTETVYQIARQTGREIVKVDISQSKSMWFGESEKRIKKIFTAYASYSELCKKTPILLFNEADAIISKRKDSGFSSVSQTENAIQNIILEELEQFKGIFIATTNLITNIDPAFDRRFLFKIEYHKPTPETTEKIWSSKLLNNHTINISGLSAKYHLSGGQIENIVRKIEMHSVLHNTLPDIDEIDHWCSLEFLNRDSMNRIGFVK